MSRELADLLASPSEGEEKPERKLREQTTLPACALPTASSSMLLPSETAAEQDSQGSQKGRGSSEKRKTFSVLPTSSCMNALISQDQRL